MTTPHEQDVVSARPASPVAVPASSQQDVDAVCAGMDDARGHAAETGVVFHTDWQPLPARTWRVFQMVGLLTAVPPALLVWWVGARRLPVPWAEWSWLAALLVTLCAVWLSHKRHRWTFWKLDVDGFAVRRGRIWQWETRVPIGRVQHIDLKRGPLERAHGLASLVVHTAGTRLAGLDLSGIDRDDAERTRDVLMREIERRQGDDADD